MNSWCFSLPAGSADTHQVDREILDMETPGLDMRDAEPIQLGVVQVEDLVTLVADEVVVPMDLAVEAGRGPGMLEPPDHTPARQGVEDPVDRGPRDARDKVLDGGEDLVGGGMIVALEHGLEDHPTLDGEGDIHAPAEGFEHLHPFGGRRRATAHDGWDFIVIGNLCQ